jgi:tRNA threonylcarbamoyladenosine biosynthesis protein TsaE
MQQTLYNLDDLKKYVNNFLSTLAQKEHATIVALSGDLGVGKTAFVKKAAEYFGIAEDITSPTFVIQKEYQIFNHVFFKKMIHIDAYRLESAHELEYLKWSETIADSETIVFIEWPEQVRGIYMPDAYQIHLEIQDKKRILTTKINH